MYVPSETAMIQFLQAVVNEQLTGTKWRKKKLKFLYFLILLLLFFISYKPSLLLKLQFDTSYGQFDFLLAKITLQNHLLHKQKRREKMTSKNSLFALV